MDIFKAEISDCVVEQGAVEEGSRRVRREGGRDSRETYVRTFFLMKGYPF